MSLPSKFLVRRRSSRLPLTLASPLGGAKPASPNGRPAGTDELLGGRELCSPRGVCAGSTDRAPDPANVFGAASCGRLWMKRRRCSRCERVNRDPRDGRSEGRNLQDSAVRLLTWEAISAFGERSHRSAWPSGRPSIPSGHFSTRGRLRTRGWQRFKLHRPALDAVWPTGTYCRSGQAGPEEETTAPGPKQGQPPDS